MKFVLWMRAHWKLMAALLLAAAAAITVGLLVAFFPPALPFIVGLSAFGWAPFAALATMSTVAASFAAAGIAAASVLVASALYNVVVGATNALNAWITPKKRDYRLLESDLELGDSTENMKKGLGLEEAPKNNCCDFSWFSSKDKGTSLFSKDAPSGHYEAIVEDEKTFQCN